MNVIDGLTLRADDIDFDEWMRETEPEHRVKPIAHWEDDINDEFDDQEGNRYPKAPWRRLDSKIAYRPGEVSLWFGFNGHGKSLLLGQTVLSMAAQRERGCIASFEMRPRKTLARMCRQFCRKLRPEPDDVRVFVKWCSGKLWVYDQTGTVQPERVYAVIRYAAIRLKVTQFVIDNLTKCVASDDDYPGQKAFVDKVTMLAMQLGIHIHLVHHARKDRDETRPPRKMDALGASAISNLVDNVFIVWRNKAKEEKPDLHPLEPDAILICDKQRHGTGWEGLQNLNFHWASQQYIEHGYQSIDLSVYPHDAISMEERTAA